MLLLVLLLLHGFQTPARYSADLPKGAVVVETRSLDKLGHPNRLLVLWMLSPKKNPNGYAPDDPYTCPDYSRGSCYSGPTRVSLIDSSKNQIINTVKIIEEESPDTFDVPYAIRKGYYYHVDPRVKRNIEVKPTIIWLRDINGDGKALEFAFYDAVACMGLQTTLIGYSEKQDRVIQYPISLEVTEGPKHAAQDTFWADYLYSQKPLNPGFWKYDVDYRGRGGPLSRWEVRYDSAREKFQAKLNVIAGE